MTAKSQEAQCNRLRASVSELIEDRADWPAAIRALCRLGFLTGWSRGGDGVLTDEELSDGIAEYWDSETAKLEIY